MIEIVKAGSEDIETLMSFRFEMLRIVNELSPEYEFSEEITKSSREYFLSGNQSTVLAKDNGKILGCASISYIEIMPTFSHPTGKRAHLMNVYVRKEYRRNQVGEKMCKALIEEAKEKCCTET